MDQSVRIGITNLPEEYLFRGWKHNFELATGIAIASLASTTAEAFALLRAGECDLIVVGRAPTRHEFPLDEFDRVDLGTDDFTVVLQSTDEHPEVAALARSTESITRAEVVDLLCGLPDHEMLIREPGSATHSTIIDDMFRGDVADGRVGGMGARLAEVRSHDAIVGRLLLAERRLSIMPNVVARVALRPGLPLKTVEISDSPRRSFYMIRRMPACPAAVGPPGTLWDFFLRLRGSASDDASELVTIVFTDLKSSTELTRRLGDEEAQGIIHGHNDAVRSAIEGHGGREVKHTGDGIMASFPSAVGALQASLDVQRSLAASEVGVRIGLNAGEPIAEDGDLFGTSVQLAARICEHAEPRQILVSNVVRELCAGKGFEFDLAGESSLRGFDEPVALYEVRAA
jgi:class 3 adenylate cyclase